MPSALRTLLHKAADLERWFAKRVYPIRDAIKYRRTYHNWRAIVAAERAGRPLPPLNMRGGIAIYSGPEDQPLLLVHEIFIRQDYGGPDFYQPQRGDVVIDIGANIGVATLYYCSAPDVRIHAYEASRSTFERLRRNVEGNRGVEECVRIYNEAVAGESGTLKLYSDGHAGHGSLFIGDDPRTSSSEEVTAITLAEAIRRTGAERIALLKLDVEGAELDILGANPADLAAVDRVALEYHDNIRPGTREAVCAILAAAGLTNQKFHTTPLGMILAKR